MKPNSREELNEIKGLPRHYGATDELSQIQMQGYRGSVYCMMFIVGLPAFACVIGGVVAVIVETVHRLTN